MKMTKITLIVLLIINSFLVYAEPYCPRQENFAPENESVEKANLKVFPNPVKENKFTVSAQNALKEVEMHNILGQKAKIEVAKMSPYKFSILIRDKKKGIYLVTIIFDDNSKMVQRIIVN